MPVIILNPIYRGIVKKVNTQQHITPKGASYYNSEFSRPSFQEHVKNEYEEHMGKKDKQGEDSHLTLIFSGKGGGVKRCLSCPSIQINRLMDIRFLLDQPLILIRRRRASSSSAYLHRKPWRCGFIIIYRSWKF